MRGAWVWPGACNRSRIVCINFDYQEDSIMTIHAYAAPGATSPLAPFDIERRTPGTTDVQIEILFCGVCHSDLHTARNEWKNTVYPVVPGHEIVGRIAHVGNGVKKFRVGDMVGV